MFLLMYIQNTDKLGYLDILRMSNWYVYVTYKLYGKMCFVNFLKLRLAKVKLQI